MGSISLPRGGRAIIILLVEDDYGKFYLELELDEFVSYSDIEIHPVA